MSDSFGAPWTVALQAPLSTVFSRQEHWSGLPLPSAGDLPNPGIEPGSPALQTDSLPPEPPGEPVHSFHGASRVAQMVKNLPAVQETQVQSLSWEDPLERRMATYSRILARRIPWNV